MGKRFGELLQEGVYRIYGCEYAQWASVSYLKEALGVKLGKQGSAMINHWGKGNGLPKQADLERLTVEIVRRGNVDRRWAESFLYAGRHPAPAAYSRTLFRERGEGTPPRAAFSYTDPFIAGPPILRPARFFGREAALERIFGVLRGERLQHVAVLGPRRSGLTSFLHYVRQITTADPAGLRPGQRTNWLPRPERFTWVYVDFRDPRLLYRERLLPYLLQQLRLPPSPRPGDLLSFLDVVGAELAGPAVILLDDIPSAVAGGDLDAPFWNGLRSLANDNRLSFILTSPHNPFDLAAEFDRSSPFFNLFGHGVRLGPLAPAEAEALMASSPLDFPAADRAWILEKSGCWPLLLQLLCHLRLYALQQPGAPLDWRREGLAQLAHYPHLVPDEA